MHLSMLCPTTPRAGSIGGFVGEFCWRTPRRGRGLVAHSVNLHANAHAYIPCGHSEWTSRTRYLLVQYTYRLCLAAKTKLSASVVALLYVAKTKVSDVHFQDSKLYLSISWGLFILNPPSGWGFDKPEVQIPTLSPIYPAWGVVGLDIDRCIISLHTVTLLPTWYTHAHMIYYDTNLNILV